jgi:hypothetical protein
MLSEFVVSTSTYIEGNVLIRKSRSNILFMTCPISIAMTIPPPLSTLSHGDQCGIGARTKKPFAEIKNRAPLFFGVRLIKV